MAPAAANGSPLQRCTILAQQQHGALGRDQAISSGLSEDIWFRRIRSGEWIRLLPRVVALAGSAPTWKQRLWAVQLWMAGRGAFSHRTAGALLRLEGFDPGPVEATIKGRGCAPKGSGLTLHYADDPLAGQVIIVDGLRITNASRTLLDLAANTPEEALERAVEDALRRHLTSVAKLEWILSGTGGRGRKGTAPLRSVISAHGDQPPTDSGFEVTVLRLLRDARLPLPVKQHEVWHEGKFLGRLDLAYPDALVAIEADGYRWHSGRTAWHRDRVKWNDLIQLGWRIYKVTVEDARVRPLKIAHDMRGLLGIGQLFD